MEVDRSLFPDHHQPQLASIFSAELRGYGWSKNLEPLYSRLRATDKFILEVPDEYQTFSIAMWDVCFPQLPSAELWHYTTLEGLAKIVNTREIWLHSLTRRMAECELTWFASEFEYLGLLSIDKDGFREADKLAQDLFFLSLTDEEVPGEMWNYGEVRLRLKITPTSAGASLRKMVYSAGDEHPLKVLKSFAQRRFNRVFVPWQVSRQGAFFLDSYYSWESEIRLLIKRFDATTDLVIRPSVDGEAVAIPIGKQNSRACIDLVRIEAETAQAREHAERLLSQVGNLQVPINVFQL